jgi:hypothetical protein
MIAAAEATSRRDLLLCLLLQRGSAYVLRLDRMKAHGKKLKRKRGPRITFGELVRKLWQPESEELEQQVANAKQKKPAAKGKRIRKS